MLNHTWRQEIEDLFASQKSYAERAVEQVPDQAFFARPAPDANSLALLMKHVGGNLRSRWRDFLTSDGEKEDRQRDSEFEAEGETRASILALWNEGWNLALGSLSALEPEDLERSVTIRGEPHSVPRAMLRSLTHSAYHTGQIVQLARQLAGDEWVSLSVPLGASEAHNEAMRAKYGAWK